MCDHSFVVGITKLVNDKGKLKKWNYVTEIPIFFFLEKGGYFCLWGSLIMFNPFRSLFFPDARSALYGALYAAAVSASCFLSVLKPLPTLHRKIVHFPSFQRVTLWGDFPAL